MDHLAKLENQSIYILREAYNKFENLGMLWSIGKDSTVLLWLARKAFLGHVPFPLVHVDTTYKIPSMIEYRDKLVSDWKLQLIVGKNEEVLRAGNTFPGGKATRVECCGTLKKDALKTVLDKHHFTGVIVGVRRDEEPTRAKERYFSPRDKNMEWNVEDQPPELWDQFKTDFEPGTHIRIHPLLHWTEVNIWEYIERENIPVIPLYFANGKNERYRSIGCYPCTSPIKSSARNVQEIIAELRATKSPERAGRAQDKESEDAFENFGATVTCDMAGTPRSERTSSFLNSIFNMSSTTTALEGHEKSKGALAIAKPVATDATQADGDSTRQLKIVIVGHVDHGKSTFVGRLLHDTGSLPEGKLEQLQKVAERRGMPFEWANLMDALQAERDQNITIDTAQIWFRTKQRQYVIIDAPGHKEFLKNMITGAASAEAALLLIDAQEGIQENSRRHGYLLHFLGIHQIAVLVNKMDLVGYSQERFDSIEREYRAFLKSLGVEARIFVPMVARDGDNIAAPSPKMSWWTGPTVLSVLDQFRTSEPPSHLPLRFSVQDVYRFDERRVLAGRVESGTLKVGDRLQFCPANKVSTVKTVERWSAPPSDGASASESIGVTLSEQIFVERGAVGARENALPYNLNRLKARVFWMGRAPFRKGKLYKLKLLAQEVDCEIDSIEKILDASTLETIHREGEDAHVGRFEIAELYLRAKRAVAFDAHSEIITTGRFVVCDGFDVVGGGIVVDDAYPRLSSDALHKSHNIYWTEGKITHEARARRNGHLGRVVWLTGLSGAGKSSVANELERELFTLGMQAYVLDGDKVRHGLCSDLGFSPDDRRENIRRIGEMAKIMADAGFICITAFISPYRTDRDEVRKRMEPGQFVEVYVNAPLDVCESRDPKGLYAKARANEIRDFTGISAPYEPPEKPELELPTHLLSVQDSVLKIVEYLREETA